MLVCQRKSDERERGLRGELSLNSEGSLPAVASFT